MSFDPKDPYDAAALYDMWFNCSSCPTTFDFEPGGVINLDYYHRIGTEARRQGWFVSEDIRFPGKEVSYTVLCPTCAARLGLEVADSGQQPNEAIDDLCELIKNSDLNRVA